MSPIYGKNTLPKESIKTKKVTNAPNFIRQSEPPSSKEMMVDKIRTDLSVLSGVTGPSVTPERIIPRKKRNMKSLATSSPRKDPIPNQDINTLGARKYQSLPPQLPKFCPGYKSLIKKEDDDCHDYADTSRTDKEYSIYTIKFTNDKNSDDKYKEENSQHQHGNGTVINKTKE